MRTEQEEEQKEKKEKEEVEEEEGKKTSRGWGEEILESEGGVADRKVSINDSKCFLKGIGSEEEVLMESGSTVRST